MYQIVTQNWSYTAEAISTRVYRKYSTADRYTKVFDDMTITHSKTKITDVKSNLTMTELFGDFREDIPYMNHEFLLISFSPTSIPIQQRWRNNGLSADFVADYLLSFYPIYCNNDCDRRRQAEVKSAVSYIANELLENAMKFNYKSSDYPIEFTLHLLFDPEDTVVLQATNSMSSKGLEKLRAFIKEIIDSDPNEFYIRQLEKSALEENSSISQLGFISMRKDYGAKLGWKIETVQNDSEVIMLTTMVQLTVEY